MYSIKIKPAIPSDLLVYWENSINTFARLMDCQLLALMIYENDNLRVLVTNDKGSAVLKRNQIVELQSGDVFEKSIRQAVPFQVMFSEKEKHSDSIPSELTVFQGVQLIWNNADIFGSLCILDSKKDDFLPTRKAILIEIKGIIERDLHVLTKDDLLNKEFNKRIEVEKQLNFANEELKAGLEKKHTELEKISKDFKTMEEDYKLIVENQNALIVKFDKNFKLSYISPQYANELGTTSEILMGASFFPFIHPDDIETVRKSHENLKYPPYECSHEERMKTIKGWRWYFWSNKSIVDENGNIQGVVAMGRDITERKEIASALEASEERYKLAMMGANDGLWDENLITGKVYLSKRWKSMLGYEESELKNCNETWENLTHPEDLQRVLNIKRNYLSGNLPKYEVEFRMLHKNGQWIDILSRGHKVTDPITNKSTRIVGTHLDITELRKAENALKESEEKNRALSESTNEALFFSDRGKFIECNKSACLMFGYNYEELIGKRGIDLIVDDAKEFVLKKMMSDYSLPFEVLSVKKDGTQFWTEFEARVYTYKGKVVRVTSVRDISARKHAEEALKFSEEKYRAAFKTSPDSINIIRLKDGAFVEINDGFSNLTGYTEEDVLGKTTVEINIWAINDERIKMLELVKKDGFCVNFEARFKLKNGSIATGLVSARLLILNKEYYIISITRDISKIKQAEQEIIKAKELAEQKEKEYRKLFNEMLDGFALHQVIYDENNEPVDYRFIDVNPAYERITGLKLKNIRNKFVLDIMPAIDKKWIRDYGKVAKTGEPFWFEDHTKELDKHYNGLAYSPQKDYFAVILTDVTDKKRTEKILLENERFLKEQNEEYQTLNEELASLNLELIDAKEKAEESDKLKTAFLANMSHEIRTPMNGIMGFTGLLIKKELNNEKKQKYIEIIKQNSHQLLSIINDLVDISKIEAGQIELEEEEVRLDSVTNTLAELYHEKAANKGIDFKLINQNSNINILTDETKLKQIFINLIDNAFKFTPQGEISFGYAVKDNFIEFFVSDTGIGIDKKAMKIIFERFRQVEMTSARRFGGTGLGLSISKAFIEKMGGEIKVESQPDKGSKFIFTIPYIIATNKVAKPIEEPVLTELNNWKNHTILIAEDELVNYKFIEEVLLDTEVNLIWATNGQEAVDYCINNKKIDLVLMDIKMPVLNGYDAVKQIKKVRPDLPIIAQTAYALMGDESKAKEAGCDDYIHKPIDMDILLQKIAKFCK